MSRFRKIANRVADLIFTEENCNQVWAEVLIEAAMTEATSKILFDLKQEVGMIRTHYTMHEMGDEVNVTSKLMALLESRNPRKFRKTPSSYNYMKRKGHKTTAYHDACIRIVRNELMLRDAA